MTLQEAGNEARKKRKELKLSQCAVGKIAGVDQAEVSKFERGRRVTLATINKIAFALCIDFNLSFPLYNK